MILMIIVVLILAVSIVFFIKLSVEDDYSALAFLVIMVFSGTASIVLTAIAITSASFSAVAKSNYNRAFQEKATIVYHLEQGDWESTMITDNESGLLVFIDWVREANDFNAEVFNKEIMRDNVFVGWYYNQLIAENADELYIDVASYID